MIKIIVAGRVWLPIADIAVEDRGRPSGFKVHRTEPIAKRAPRIQDTLRVAMNDDRKSSSGKMARIIPSLEFDSLRFGGILSDRRCRRQRRLGNLSST